MSSIKRVAVLGAGTMGAGIAELCASRGLRTALFDVSVPTLHAALAGVRTRQQKRHEKGALSAAELELTLGSLFAVDALDAAVREADLVIEAVPEDMALKVRVIADALPHASSRALVASNTSSLSITELGRRVGAAERVVGMHFFNPAPVMPLIELVCGLSTSADTIAAATAFVELLGKEHIVVNDAPGFATSRLGVLLGAEAIRMLESGVASVRDIDRAMELGYRHPMGPLKLTDLVGLDVRLAILEVLQREIGDQFRPPVLLRKLVRAGNLGKKSGRGFYVWTAEGPIPNPELLR